MTAPSPDFYRILSDTIARSGALSDMVARQEIYERARATIRARAGDEQASGGSALEHHLGRAIAQIESELSPDEPKARLMGEAGPASVPVRYDEPEEQSAPKGAGAPANGNSDGAGPDETEASTTEQDKSSFFSLPKTFPRVATKPSPAPEALADKPSEAPTVTEPDGAAAPVKSELAPAPNGTAEPARMPESAAEDDTKTSVFSALKSAGNTSFFDRLKTGDRPKVPEAALADGKAEADVTKVAADTALAAVPKPAPAPVEPPVRQRERPPELPEARVAVALDDDPIVSRSVEEAERASAADFGESLKSGTASITDPANDALDRIAADLAAGFKDFDGFRDFAQPKDQVETQVAAEPTVEAQATAAKAKAPAASDDHVEALAEEVGRLSDLDDGAETDDATEKLSAKRFLPSGLSVSPGAIVVALLGCLFLGSTIYFALNPVPADPAFARAAERNAIAPAFDDLSGDAWVPRSIDIAASTTQSWGGFELADTSTERPASIALPLNELASPNGFRATVRIKKTESRVNSFPAIRITVPLTRRPNRYEVMIDPSTGDLRPSGLAQQSNVSIIDDGDSWRVALAAPAVDGIYFAKPLFQIFPAFSSSFDGFDPAATGTVIVGDILIESL